MSNEAPADALRLVPTKATPQMIAAMDKNIFGYKMGLGSDFLHGVWAAALAAAPASPLPEGGDILWMMHVRGPDDIYPAPDYESAVAWCDYVNDVLAKAVPEVMTKAVPAIWTGTPESHADGLPDAIKGWTLPAAPTGDA